MASPSPCRIAIGGVPADPEEAFARGWDHIVIGAGSAGCIVANRLSEDPAASVLLLEAGTAADDPAVLDPAAWPSLAGGSHDWGYRSTPQRGLSGRVVGQPRGKGLGGSTLINALGFQRGPMQAYDRWAEATGDSGWGAAGLLPYFRRLEAFSAGADAYRGGDGPLGVLAIEQAPEHHPLSEAYAAAGIDAGHPYNPDLNGARPDGTIWTQLTMRDGRRETAASAYLDPIRDRANLGIATGVTVRRLMLERRRCVGVELAGDGIRSVRSTGETILCAGAIDSPRLLLLSGIGDADALRGLGIGTACDLPEVGRNLQDHPLVPGLLFRSSRPLALSRYNHCETMVIARSRQAPGRADLQLMGLTVPFLAPELGTPPPDSFSIVPALMRVHSRGSVTLATADPAASAVIDPDYLADDRDVEALVDAIELARKIAARPPLAEWIAQELFPGTTTTSRTALARHIRATASPFYHPVGTCAMGAHDRAVTDAAARVRGIEGLRVVDASIMPSLPQAMTNAAVMALAERAADLIRGA